MFSSTNIINRPQSLQSTSLSNYQSPLLKDIKPAISLHNLSKFNIQKDRWNKLLNKGELLSKEDKFEDYIDENNLILQKA